MNDQEIFAKLKPIFQDVFDDEELNLTLESTPKDVKGWDSLSNVRLFVAVEKLFKIRFDTKEISNVKSVGGFVRMILSKQSA